MERLTAAVRIGGEKKKQLCFGLVVEVKVRVDSGVVVVWGHQCLLEILAPLADVWMVSEAHVCCSVTGCQ